MHDIPRRGVAFVTAVSGTIIASRREKSLSNVKRDQMGNGDKPKLNSLLLRFEP